MNRTYKKLVCFLISAILLCSVSFMVFATDGTDNTENSTASGDEGTDDGTANVPEVNAPVSIPSKPADYLVYDIAEVLSQFAVNEIKEVNTTQLVGKGEVVVVCVKTTGDYTIKDYAKQIYDNWAIGTLETRTGALLVMDIEGGNYYAIVGEGFSTKFPGSTLDNILANDVEAYFDVKDYDNAASSFASKISKTITGDLLTATPVPEEKDEKPASSIIWNIFQIIIIIVAIAVTLVIGFVIVANIRAKKLREKRRLARKSGRRPKEKE